MVQYFICILQIKRSKTLQDLPSKAEGYVHGQVNFEFSAQYPEKKEWRIPQSKASSMRKHAICQAYGQLEKLKKDLKRCIILLLASKYFILSPAKHFMLPKEMISILFQKVIYQLMMLKPFKLTLEMFLAYFHSRKSDVLTPHIWQRNHKFRLHLCHSNNLKTEKESKKLSTNQHKRQKRVSNRNKH